MMRHVHDIHILALQRTWNGYAMPPVALVFRLIHLLEIVGKRAKLVKVSMRSDQQVFVLTSDRREIAHEIPEVRAYAELVDVPNVDCDTHTLGRCDGSCEFSVPSSK